MRLGTLNEFLPAKHELRLESYNQVNFFLRNRNFLNRVFGHYFKYSFEGNMLGSSNKSQLKSKPCALQRKRKKLKDR